MEAKGQAMTSADWDEEEIAKAMRRLLNAEYLKKYIKEPLEEAAASLLAEDKMFRTESTDVVLLLIFTHIDLLGYLYTGDTSRRKLSENAVKFLREYLGRIDSRYKEVGGLLYDALRHGLVHLTTPKRMLLKNGMILDFSFTPAGRREKYLKVTKREEIEKVGKIEICRLSIDLSQLYEDLLSAMDMYAEDIRHNQALSEVFQKAFETRRQPEKAKEEELLNKPYIQQSDFDFVREQISFL